MAKNTPQHGRLRWRTLKAFVRLNLMTILTVSGVVAGIVLGYILKASRDPGKWDQRSISYVTYPGELFLSMLNGLVLPLVFTSIIAAVASLDLKMSTRIGGIGMTYFLVTTLLAASQGAFLALSIQPGTRVRTATELRGMAAGKESEPTLVQDTLMDLGRAMFPPNYVQAALEHYKTKLTLPENKTNQTRGNKIVKIPLEEYEMHEHYEKGTNLLGILVLAMALGVTLAKLGEKGELIARAFQILSEAMTVITGWVIRLSPIGVTSLIAGEMLRVRGVTDIATSLGLYLVTILIGHSIHGFIFLPIIYFFLTWKQPFGYIVNMAPAFFTAFGTGSSSATLPVTIQCVEEKNKVDPRISRFLLPIGATINMDGSALFQAVAAVFIAQLVGMQMTVGKIVIVVIMSTAASAAAAGIPQGGFLTLVMVLSTMGLPGRYISYVLPIDWLIDRSRTAINVLGDAIGAGVVQEMCMDDLYTLPLTITIPKQRGRASVSTRDEGFDDNEMDHEQMITPPPSPTGPDGPIIEDQKEGSGTKVELVKGGLVTSSFQQTRVYRSTPPRS